MATMLLPRNDDKNAGTVAVIIFIAGAIVLVLIIILVLLFFKKRHSARSKPNTFIPRLERQRGGNYGKLEEDEEGAWSADMGHDQDGGAGGTGKGSYAPVHNESMGYQSQTLHHGDAAKDSYR